MIGRGRNLSVIRDEIQLSVRSNRQSLRLDQFLKSALSWQSRTRIQRLVREQRVKVNGATAAKPSMFVRPGDQVLVKLTHGAGMPDYEAYRLERLYEDAWLLALNKPPGLLVHPVGRHVYDTLINYLHYHYRDVMAAKGADTSPRESSRKGLFHLRLCHRIDKDTTGVLLVGKETYVHQSVQRQFENRLVSKRYLALALGRVPTDLDVIDRPLAEGRSLQECLGGADQKPSRTAVQVLETFEHNGESFSWIAASPLTGRQNQIRLHLAAVGHPIVGDQKFGSGPPPPQFPERFILHAQRLSFHHPRLKSRVILEAPLPGDVEALLETLRTQQGRSSV